MEVEGGHARPWPGGARAAAATPGSGAAGENPELELPLERSVRRHQPNPLLHPWVSEPPAPLRKGPASAGSRKGRSPVALLGRRRHTAVGLSAALLLTPVTKVSQVGVRWKARRTAGRNRKTRVRRRGELFE